LWKCFPIRVRVLADLAERADEIDLAWAQVALSRAQTAVVETHADLDPATALTDMMRAQTRIEVAKK
jgi:F-type H+-transporting ATPase subunit epsilon